MRSAKPSSLATRISWAAVSAWATWVPKRYGLTCSLQWVRTRPIGTEQKPNIGAKVQLAQYAPLILYFYLGADEDGNALWWGGISLGFSRQAARKRVLEQLRKRENSLADESDSYGTDSYLLDFSLSRPLAEIEEFPSILEDVVSQWLENCRAVGGIKLDL